MRARRPTCWPQDVAPIGAARQEEPPGVADAAGQPALPAQPHEGSLGALPLPLGPCGWSSSEEESEKASGSEAEAGGAGESEGDEPGNRGPRKGRQSIRRSFLQKVLGPVAGYSEEYELLHFVYDLVMWSTLGGTKNSAKGIPLRLALKNASFSPEYWRARHLALLDLQRQVGLPFLFRTRAPYERSFPYHVWVMDEMAGPRAAGVGGTGDPPHGPRPQGVRGFFSGMNRRTAGKSWREHLLGAADGSGAQTVINFVSRLEFQDGKRKTGTQRYHGRGTVHSHSLDFLRNVGAVKLEDKLSASLPDAAQDPVTRGIVLDSQPDRKSSKVPIREEPSAWDEAGQKVLIHHSEEDHGRHGRTYFPK